MNSQERSYSLPIFLKITPKFLHRYLAPEYACTGILNESSDVYSFRVLLIEIILGRCPIDYSRPPEEVHLH